MATSDGAPCGTCVLKPNDVVVYDRGYFSYACCISTGPPGSTPCFVRQDSGSIKEIQEFFAGPDTDDHGHPLPRRTHATRHPGGLS